MPCLDAVALTNDIEGLDFLRSVLETEPGMAPAVGAFDTSVVHPGWTMFPPEPLRPLTFADQVVEPA